MSDTALLAPAGSLRGPRAGVPLCVCLVFFAAALAWGPRLLHDPDVFLHITVGQWILEHRAVPQSDVFSFSVPGRAWVPHEWLTEVLWALLYRAFGWAGLIVATALCFGAALGWLQRELMRYVPPSHALVGTMLAAGLCFPHLLARPHAFSLLLIVIWMGILVRAAAASRAPPPTAALLIALWSNLHSGYMVGLLMAAMFGAEALIDAPDRESFWRALRQWFVFGALSGLAALATPNGIAGVWLPFELIRMNFSLSIIGEWQSPNFQHPHPLEFWLMLLFLGGFSLGLRVPVTRTAMFLVLLDMALKHQRMTEMLGLATPLLFAPAFAAQLEGRGLPRLDRIMDDAARRRVAAYGAVVAMALLAAATLRLGIANNDKTFAPGAALAFARAHGLAGNVFNDINFGDYLIANGVAPFIDGRIDMYGDNFVRRYVDIGGFPALAARYRISWAILTPDNPHVPLLQNLAGWRRLYADKYAVLYGHDAGPASQP